MKQLSEEQLNKRIESFIARKHQQYPELALRGNKRETQSIGYYITGKISNFTKSLKSARLAH